jgi:hypothetical protein
MANGNDGRGFRWNISSAVAAEPTAVVRSVMLGEHSSARIILVGIRSII